MPAQQLPGLKRHSRYHCGTLRCGVPYTLATTAVDKGRADFALICDAEAVPDPSAVLDSLPHFPNDGPWRFLSAHGAGLGREGYISRKGDAVVFRFDNLNVSDGTVRDSALLLLTDLILRTPGGNHSLIATGDLDPTSTKTALDYLSMMLPHTQKHCIKDKYRWVHRDTAVFQAGISPEGTAEVEAYYRMPRTPRERLNTVIPYLTSVYNHALGSILYRRIRTSCLAEHIPYGAIECFYYSSAESPSDEAFSLRVVTDTASVDRMVEIVAETLSSIDRKGVLPEEYADATGQIYHYLLRFGRLIDKETLMEKCIAASLYGSDLASEVEVAKFLTSRSLRKEEECRLLNMYAGAMLDSAANLSLRVSGSRDADPLGRFQQAWGRRDVYVHTYVNNRADSLNLSVEPVKTKVRRESPDPVSGGTLWHFANGVDVVFKRTDGDPGYFHYGWLLRGGYPLVKDLADGEGAFVGDMLRLNYVGPLKGLDFYNMLQANDITLTPEVGIQDMRLQGSARSSELELLIRSLLELSLHRKVDPGAFETYRANQALALSEGDGIDAGLWGLMWPLDRYTPWKDIANLTDALPAKAESYFSERFARCNDGVLVLIGDLDPGYTKRLLSRWLGAMRTSTRRTAPLHIDSQARSGHLTVLRDGTPGCHFLIRLPLLYTAKNVWATELAQYRLADCLAAELTAAGQRFTMENDFVSYPAGEWRVTIHTAPAAAEALPTGIPVSDPIAAQSAIRQALSRAAEAAVSDKQLKADKARLEEILSNRLKTEESLVEAVMKRYGEGKDLMTGYKQRIAEVSAADLQTLLGNLRDAARIEYISHEAE